MIEDEESTAQRPLMLTEDDNTTKYPIPTPAVATEAPTPAPTATIQVPTNTVETEKGAPVTPTLPAMESTDLLNLKIVSDPQLSPDGTQIAFSVLQCNAEHNTTSSTIWLVASQGGKAHPPEQLTSGAFQDTNPRWSPDGRTLAFLRQQKASTQLHILPMHGGEARQISTLPQDITTYSWRPDGQMLLAQSYWKPTDEQVDPTHNADPLIYTRLDEQWDGIGYKQGRFQQLWLLALDGKATRLTSEPVDLVQSAWSPDGTEIIFCANRRPDPDLSVSMALWVLTLATGQMRRLTPEDGLAQQPAWSPDGQFIAYIYTRDQTEAGNMCPWIVAADGNGTPQPAVSEAEKLTCQTWIIDELRNEWLAPPIWYPDSKALLLPVQEQGQVHLYRLEREQDSIERLTSGNGRYLSPQLSKNGQLVSMVRADWFTPGDIWSMDSQSKHLRKLTRVNDTLLQSHQLIRPKRVTWKSFDEQEIEGWLYLPTLIEQTRAPMIIAPHGGPSLAWGDGYIHEFQVLASHGYAVFAPNPRGSAGYGEAFSRQVINDWGGGDFLDLLAGIDHLIATEAIDENRLGIGGLSYGGYMTNWAITQSNRFKAAVSRNGISSLSTATHLSDQTVWFKLVMDDERLQQQRSPLTFANDIITPLLLLHADGDLRCPFSEAMQLYVHLRKRKQKVELVRYQQSSHLMDWPQVGTPHQRLDRLQRTVTWFKHFL